jgi:uncharacterized membrane protein
MMRVGLWTFLHLLGMALWLGGMFTAGIWTSTARATADHTVIAFAYGTAGRIYRVFVAAGAWITIGAGVVLTFTTSRAWFSPFPEHWLFQMQIFGLLAFAATVLYVIPNSTALARLAGEVAESGELKPEFQKRVKAQAIVGSAVGGILIYAVLLGSLRF